MNTDNLPSDYFMNTLYERECLSRGGADTMYLSLKVDWQDYHYEKARPYIDWVQRVLKEELRPTDQIPDDDFSPLLDFNGHKFEIQGYGANPGDSKFSYFPYVLRELGIRYMFNRKEYDFEMPAGNAYVVIGSKPLMRWGEQVCYDIINHAIRTLGGEIIECTLSRIDLCVDLADVKVQPFVDAVYNQAYVCRARNQSFYQQGDELNVNTYTQHKKYTGVTIGRSNVLCRIYDKLLETKNDEEKRMLLETNRFGGKLPNDVTRVEFQLRRDALRGITVNGKCDEGIRTFEEYQNCRKDLLNYLCNSWLRFYNEPVINRNHSERLKQDDYLPEWTIAVNEFLNLEKTSEIKDVTKVIRNRKPSCDRLKSSLTGFFTSILAVRKDVCNDDRDLRRNGIKLFREIVDDVGWEDIIKRKQEKEIAFEARSTRKYDGVPF